MASQGEISYHQFIQKLVQKASSSYVSFRDTQNLGSYFWGLLSEAFKNDRRAEDKRKAFWLFSQFLKDCVVNQNIAHLNELWQYFDTNGKNYWENFYENALVNQVHSIL